MRARRASGFTLIELMIAIAIMALLLLAAAPFTLDWVDGTRQMRARNNLLEAVGRARALAMRNPHALTAAEATQGAAAVVYDSATHTLCVVPRNADGTAWKMCGTGDWRGQIANPANLSLASGAADDAEAFVCAAYDTRGVLVASSFGGSACITPSAGSATTVFIKVGSQEAMDVVLL